jgi:hypothetical protein
VEEEEVYASAYQNICCYLLPGNGWKSDVLVLESASYNSEAFSPHLQL